MYPPIPPVTLVLANAAGRTTRLHDVHHDWGTKSIPLHAPENTIPEHHAYNAGKHRRCKFDWARDPPDCAGTVPPAYECRKVCRRREPLEGGYAAVVATQPQGVVQILETGLEARRQHSGEEQLHRAATRSFTTP
jgi:hypothetical protein